ncbi:MAG: hypothetical protein EOP34_07315, partial [Rickettsiales bacterium]
MSETEQIEENIQQQAASPKSKKKLVVIAILLTILISVTVYFFLKKKHELKKEDKKIEATSNHKEDIPKEQIFLNLDEFLVNLQNGDKQASFLKIEVTLQISNKDVVKTIQDKMPII